MMVKRAEQFDTAVTLFQETKYAGYHEKKVHDHLFFLHGTEDQEKRSGVGIMLAPLAIAAWKCAGSPSPIKLMCAKAARLIGVELHFLDEKQRTMKIFVISAHMPHSDEKTYTDEDYEDCITQLIGMMSLCDDDVIPFVGADLNARIGTRSQHDEMAAQIIGPHSLPETNNRG